MTTVDIERHIRQAEADAERWEKQLNGVGLAMVRRRDVEFLRRLLSRQAA